MPQRPSSPPGLHPDSVSNLRYLNYLVNSRYWEILPIYRRQLEDAKATRPRNKNWARLTVDVDRAKQYDYVSCSGHEKPVLTEPETAQNQPPGNSSQKVLGPSRKRSRSSEENAYEEPHPQRKPKRHRPNSRKYNHTEKPIVNIPSSGLFSLVRLQSSSTIATVIRRYHGRWILAKAKEDLPCIQSRNYSRNVADRQIITIRVPVAPNHGSTSSRSWGTDQDSDLIPPISIDA